MDANPYYSADNLQNSKGLEKIEGNVVSSSSLKFSTSKARGINRISIKTPDNYDIKDILNPFCEPKDPTNDQIPVKFQTPIIKSEPIDDNVTIEEDTIFDVNYFADNSQTTSNSHNNIVKVKNSVSKYGSQSTTNTHNVVKVIDDRVTPSLLKKSTSKYEGINKISLKTTNNVKQPMYNKSKHLGTNQISIKVHTPVTKFEPETSNIHNLVKDEIRLSPSLLKNSTTKHQANHKKSIKAAGNCGVQYVAHNFHCEPKKLGNEQISMKLTTPVIKCEPEDFNDTSKENIEMVINPSYSSNGLKSTVVSHNLVKIDQIVLPSKSFASQHQDANDSSIKTTDNSKNHLIYNLNYKPKNLGNDLTSVRDKIPIIKLEPENNKSTTQPNFKINLRKEKEWKFVNPNKIHSADNGNTESQKIIIKKMETIVSSIKSEDIDSQTDKKKISWEEFRAKREKMGLINISGNIYIY